MKGQVSIWVIMLFSRVIRENCGNILWISTCHHMALQNDKQKQYIYLKKQIVSNFKNRFTKSTIGIKYSKPVGYFVVHIGVRVQKYPRPSSPGQFFFYF